MRKSTNRLSFSMGYDSSIGAVIRSFLASYLRAAVGAARLAATRRVSSFHIKRGYSASCSSCMKASREDLFKRTARPTFRALIVSSATNFLSVVRESPASSSACLYVIHSRVICACILASSLLVAAFTCTYCPASVIICTIKSVLKRAKRCKNLSNFRIRREDFAGLIDETEPFIACVWPLADRYRIVGGLVYPEGDWKISFPLSKGADLFLSFARLGANPSNNSIQRWVNKHGLLLRGGNNQRPARTSLYEQGPDGRIIVDQAPMKLEKLKAEIMRARDLLDLYTELQSRNIEAIEARVANPKTAIDKSLGDHPEWPGLQGAALKAYESLGGRPGYEWNLWVATRVLADELTEAASGIRLRATLRDKIEGLDYSSPYTGSGEQSLFFEPPYALDSAWYCPDLLSALYLQFYLLVTRQKPTRRCENPACLMPFPVTRKNKRFCNSTCRSNARNYPKS